MTHFFNLTRKFQIFSNVDFQNKSLERGYLFYLDIPLFDFFVSHLLVRLFCVIEHTGRVMLNVSSVGHQNGLNVTGEDSLHPARSSNAPISSSKIKPETFVNVWESYGLKGKLGKLKAQVNGSARPCTTSDVFPDSLRHVPDGENTSVNSLQDNTFATAQQVYSAKLRKTSENGVVEEYDRMREEAASRTSHQQRVRVMRKTKKRPKQPRQKGKEEEEVILTKVKIKANANGIFRNKKKRNNNNNNNNIVDISQEEAGDLPSNTKRSSHRPSRVSVPMPSDEHGNQGILAGLPVESLEDYRHSDDQMELFARAVTRAGRATEDIILNMPPITEVLSYCRQFQNKECMWYYKINHKVSNADSNLKYPDVCVLSRKYMESFYRECDPSQPYERPCINLDRDPRPGEGKIRCVAHALSEKVLGPGKGYRLRELILRDEMTQVNAAIAHNNSVRRKAAELSIPIEQAGDLVNPRDWLSNIQEPCIMCHIYFTNMDYIRQRDKEIEKLEQERREQESARDRVYGQGGNETDVTDFATMRGIGDVNEPMENDSIVIANRFMVIPNRPGEYPLSMTLTGDKSPTGIWGPFPIWNNQNYIPVKISGTGMRGFKETDNLVFRAPQRSQPIGSLLRPHSSRSTPTQSTQQNFSSHQ